MSGSYDEYVQRFAYPLKPNRAVSTCSQKDYPIVEYRHWRTREMHQG